MNQERTQEILREFNTARLLIIGDVVLDQYVRGVVERLNPEAPVPILNAREEYETTGGAGNVAKNTAALGAQTVLVSVVGQDPLAEKVEVAARREGYQPLMVRDDSRPTIRKMRYIVQSQQLLRVDYEEIHDAPVNIEDQLIAAIEEWMPKIDGVIVSDYAKGVVTQRVAAALLAAAQQHQVLVAADFKPSRAPFLAGADFVSPNLKEGHEILGLNYVDQRQSPSDIAQRLREKLVTDVYLTLGAEGILVATRDGVTEHVPQEHVAEVFDVSGAGDTAIAILMLARLSGATAVEAAHLANAGGAVVVEKVGSVAVTSEELLHMAVNKHSLTHTAQAR